MIEPRERTRGHGGVAICVRKKFDQFSELLPDGGNRIIAIKLKGAIPIQDTQNIRKQTKRIIWKKIDKQKYAKDVEDDLKLFSSDITCENAAEKIQQLCTILNKNAEKQFKQPVKKRKKRKICWSPDIAAAAKTSKECYGKWKSLGKQKDPTQSAYIELKISKKVLRSTQRKSAAQKRNEKYERIMELNENDSEGFYQLIRKQRDPGNTCASAFIFKEEIINTDPEIREAWADYFYDLATPSENPNFDPIFKNHVEQDVQNLHKYFLEENQHNIEHVSTDVVEKTILSFKNGKSPDELNISAEHLKIWWIFINIYFSFIINFLFKHVHIPALIKSGIVCPVFKSGGKPKDDPNSYRKITITSSVGKVVEKIHLSRNEK
ncbi:Hypothetical predicted protein [Mytilus galloprovincialis]|uniref:Uncharacterized protein n=1 Tax=Mytilus galloprovincialis TaxID=29158 RepID=A0A8B6DW39_MYTGA|nr:Hypothetical predicted protein [Mytilus galloprovincialis]